MPYAGFSTKRDEYDALTDSYTYYTYEQEKRRDELLSSTRNEEITRTRKQCTSSGESTPIHQTDTNNRKTISKGQTILVMVACIYIHCAGFGLVVALGVIYVELIEAFSAPRADAALVQSLYMGMSLGGGVIFAKLFDRYNPGHCVIIASFIGTAALIGGSFGTNIATLIALVGVILGIIMSCNILATFVTVTRLFTTNRKFALAILTFGSTIGQILLPFVTYALIENYYWNGALLVLSGLTILNCIPCGLVIMFALKSIDQKNIYGENPRTVSLFKDALFYFYVFTYFIFLTFGPVEQWFSADLAVMKGFSFEEGSTLLSVNGGAGIAGRFLGTLLIKIFKDVRPEIYLSSAFIFWAIAHYTIYVAPEYWILVLCMVLRGLSAGVVVATLPSTQLELSGLTNFAITVAVCNCVGGVGEILGGYIGGLTVDITGNYQMIFLLATFSAVYCAVSYAVIYYVLSRSSRAGSVGSYTKL